MKFNIESRIYYLRTDLRTSEGALGTQLDASNRVQIDNLLDEREMILYVT
jgi:hypothetical protein